MKLLFLPLLANFLFAVSLVIARPIQIEIISSSSSIEIHGFRLGQADVAGTIPPTHLAAHIIEPAESSSAEVVKHKKGCGMHKMRMQAIRFSNWLRNHLGLPMIESPHKFEHEHVPFKPLPLIGVPMTSSRIVSPEEDDNIYHLTHRHPHGHMKPKSFFGRLHKALMTLGIWEGRLVAFVIGCGIGSLLRMLWVLLVVLSRSRTMDPDTTTPIYLYVEEADEVEPPRYSDDKVKHDGMNVKQVA